MQAQPTVGNRDLINGAILPISGMLLFTFLQLLQKRDYLTWPDVIIIMLIYPIYFFQVSVGRKLHHRIAGLESQVAKLQEQINKPPAQ
jgi:hypothetical protein